MSTVPSRNSEIPPISSEESLYNDEDPYNDEELDKWLKNEERIEKEEIMAKASKSNIPVIAGTAGKQIINSSAPNMRSPMTRIKPLKPNILDKMATDKVAERAKIRQDSGLKWSKVYEH